MQAVKGRTFEDRLSQIAKTQGASVYLHVGEGSDKKAAEKARKVLAQQKAKPRSRRKSGFGAGLIYCVLAFSIGFGAMLGGRYLAFHYGPGNVTGDDVIGMAVAMGGDLGIAVGIGAVAALLFGLFSVPRAMALGAGFVLVMYGEGAIASKVPEIWVQMFSPGYTRAVIADQQPINFSVDSVKTRLSGLGRILG